MFFSSDLLQRRDNGLGLLWLAATLGDKSNLKKLSKRSVMSANIAQLCNLVSQPSQPLSLRLSSNLMVGVVRVYRVKNEMLYTDTANCVASLKRVVQDMRQSSDLSMQNLARPETLVLAHDPAMDLELEFGLMDEVAIPNTFAASAFGYGGLVIESPNASMVLTQTPTEKSGEQQRLMSKEPLSSGISDMDFGQDFFPMGDADDGMDVLLDMSNEIAKDAGGAWLNFVNDEREDAQLQSFAYEGDISDGLHFEPMEALGEFDLAPDTGGDVGDPEKQAPRPKKRVGEDIEDINAPEDKEPSNPNRRDTIVRKARKRARLLVDTRTQLTDQEMMESRKNYVQLQMLNRLSAPQLQSVWSNMLGDVARKPISQINLVAGDADHQDFGPIEPQILDDGLAPWGPSEGAWNDQGMDMFQDADMGWENPQEDRLPSDRALSSSDLGQARGSMAPYPPSPIFESSITGRSFDLAKPRSQVLAPWDNASVGRSIDSQRYEMLPDNIEIGPLESTGGAVFGLDGVTQRTDVSAATKEGNTDRFLEYAKMNQNILRVGEQLTLQHLIPKESSSRIAADGFYYCLVLATRGFIGVHQPESYGDIGIRIQ